MAAHTEPRGGRSKRRSLGPGEGVYWSEHGGFEDIDRDLVKAQGERDDVGKEIFVIR